VVTSQVTLPAPRTWSPGDQVTVPRLRADAGDAVALLTQRPLFVGQRTSGDSWSTTSDLGLPMDASLTDTWGGHLAPPATGTGNYWAPLPGWYLCQARVPFAYSSATPAPFMCGFQGLTNGAAFGPWHGAITVNGSGSYTITPQALDLIEQVKYGAPNGGGDYIQPVARQDSGASVSLQSLSYCMPTVCIRWVCAASGTQPLPVPPLAAVPTPITSAWLNANVRDAVSFLVYPPVAKAHYVAGSSSLANSSLASPQAVPLTTADTDNYGGMNLAGSTYTAPVAGRYLLAGQYTLASSSASAFYACGLLVNGATGYWGRIAWFSGSGLAGGASIVKRLRLAAGDQVQLVAAQNSGAAIACNATASNQTRFIAVWEGI
jgi:hypothetical protein